MAPPLHVKVIAGVLNTVLTIAGIRNIIAPGTPVPIIPEDDVFQRHFHGDVPGADPKIAWGGGFLVEGVLPKSGGGSLKPNP